MGSASEDLGDLWASAERAKAEEARTSSRTETRGKVLKFPTRDEYIRTGAIERAKGIVLPHLIALAAARIGNPIPTAGVTADDVFALMRVHAPNWLGLIGTDGRSLSWMGPWLAGLARRGALAAFFVEGVPVSRRATERDASHGNAHRVYLHPDAPRVVGGPRSQRPTP